MASVTDSKRLVTISTTTLLVEALKVEMIAALSEETSISLVIPLKSLMLSSKNKSAMAYSIMPRT